MSDDVAEAVEIDLPLETVGSRLQRGREAAGLSLAQVAADTRIGERQLKALEDGNYAALNGRTYAIGFSRTYARLLGLNELEIADGVRRELQNDSSHELRRPVQTFEPGDPARLPSARLAWLAGGLIALVIAGALVVWPSLFAPTGKLGEGAADAPRPMAISSTAPAAIPAPAPSGPVTFAALAPAVWVRFTDVQGNQVFQKELSQGETYTVPADKGEVFLRTARPEALAITIGGQAVPKIADVQRMVNNVPVSAAALLARGGASAAPVPVAAGTGKTAPRPSNRGSVPRRDTQPIAPPPVEASSAPAELPNAPPANGGSAAPAPVAS